MRPALLLPVLLAIVALPSQSLAQAHEDNATSAAADSSSDETGSAPGHISTFTEGHHHGWLFASPHFDVNAGAWHTTGTTNAAPRFHLQYAPGAIRAVEVAWDLLFLPARGATPVVSAIVQYSPLPEYGRVYGNVGAGGITGHSASGDRLNGWLEATLAYRSPFHDVTPFVQIGHATGAGNRFEFLFALAHPISPYHVPHHGS